MNTPAKLWLVLIGSLVLLPIATSAADAPLPQRLLYIGHRAPEFQPFLKTHFAQVEVTTRESFQPPAAKNHDVVLFDWPQGGSARLDRLRTSPLGDRADWEMPTVLLGSAGLNLAVVWKVKGGSG